MEQAENNMFQLTWVGLVRMFTLANYVAQSSELNDFLLNTLAHLYSQCNDLQKERLQELCPLVVANVKRKVGY